MQLFIALINTTKALSVNFLIFLSEIMPEYDKVLIAEDFNIHVCCLAMPLVKDFLNRIDFLNLEQCVTVPTHKLGHALDLVLTYGLSAVNIKIHDAVFADHMVITFEISVPSHNFKPKDQCVVVRFLIRPLHCCI